ncbi:MAG TPA: ABC transporter permease [Bacteroidales bacterium]|nr:ABC transporter permease [Bacteroidales bacterium]
MKLLSIIRKSLKEQYRSFWLFILTVSTAPFFVFVYYLIVESYEQKYRIDIVNNDIPVQLTAGTGYGIQFLHHILHCDTLTSFEIKETVNRVAGEERIKSRKTDVLVILPENFSEKISGHKNDPLSEPVAVEFIGDLSSMKYMIGAVWIYSMISEFISAETGISNPLQLNETPIGISGNRTDFELSVPGLLILSIIMLMLSASSAMVYESENKTLGRLKITRVSTSELLGGISVIQLLVGVISVALALISALILGFRYEGSLILVFLISVLTSLSIIAFCLIIAAFSKTVTQVLVVGNFPLFLFMFFSGAMFPIQTKPWFSVAGYEISLISLLSPNHAVSALSKVLFMQEGFTAIIPELFSLLILSFIYGIIGSWLYYRRHLKIE